MRAEIASAAEIEFYKLTSSAKCLVLDLNEKLNDAPWIDIDGVGKEIIAQVNEAVAPRLVVDLSALPYMNILVDSLIVRVWKAVKIQRGEFVVVCPNNLVLEVLDLSGLLRLWKTTTSREAAIASFDPKPASNVLKKIGLILGWVVPCAAAAGFYCVLIEPFQRVSRESLLWVTTAFSVFGFLIGISEMNLMPPKWRVVAISQAVVCLIFGIALALIALA